MTVSTGEGGSTPRGADATQLQPMRVPRHSKAPAAIAAMLTFAKEPLRQTHASAAVAPGTSVVVPATGQSRHLEFPPFGL